MWEAVLAVLVTLGGIAGISLGAVAVMDYLDRKN